MRQTNVKVKYDDRDGGACFVALKGNDVETKSMAKIAKSVKVISIQALSQRMFLILDSHGDLHLLSLSYSGFGADITGHVRQLPHVMKVQSLAVLPDVSASKFLCLIYYISVFQSIVCQCFFSERLYFDLGKSCTTRNNFFGVENPSISYSALLDIKPAMCFT